MESQPQNPEFRINPENFHPCIQKTVVPYSFVSFRGGVPVPPPSRSVHAASELTRIDLLAHEIFVFILQKKKVKTKI